MQSTSFNPETDLAPLPFDETHCRLAAKLKEAGLQWHPHAGCFVWDKEEVIPAPSPFPFNIYFILNLNRFVEILKSIEAIQAQLVWLPTWHQIRLVYRRLGIADSAVQKAVFRDTPAEAGEDLLILYQILLDRLQSRNTHQAF